MRKKSVVAATKGAAVQSRRFAREALKRKQAGGYPACAILVGGAGFEPATLAV